MKHPKIMITMEGGVIQSVTSNVGMHVVIVDYDGINENSENNKENDYGINVTCEDAVVDNFIDCFSGELSGAEQKVYDVLKKYDL